MARSTSRRTEARCTRFCCERALHSGPRASVYLKQNTHANQLFFATTPLWAYALLRECTSPEAAMASLVFMTCWACQVERRGVVCGTGVWHWCWCWCGCCCQYWCSPCCCCCWVLIYTPGILRRVIVQISAHHLKGTSAHRTHHQSTHARARAHAHKHTTKAHTPPRAHTRVHTQYGFSSQWHRRKWSCKRYEMIINELDHIG